MNADDGSALIAENRKARHEYFIEDRYEAGLSLLGWEVKSLRAGRAQLTESYVHHPQAARCSCSARTSRR